MSYLKGYRIYYSVSFFFLFFLILYIVIGGLIKLEDGGPVFYKAGRIGRHSKIFEMYKFRSMKIDAEYIERRR